MDSSEFEILFKKLYPILCRYAFMLIGDRAMAEDIVQEQFAYLWENDDRLKIISVEAYLFRSVKNKSINYLKSYAVRKVIKIDQSMENSFISDWNNNIEHNELCNLIRKAMLKLPEKCHDIFYLKRIEGLSTREIALKLYLSEKTVENQMTIALRKLAGYLNKFMK
jgi:RNA polymerase sigma-70 factor, ECF subfamily